MKHSYVVSIFLLTAVTAGVLYWLDHGFLRSGEEVSATDKQVPFLPTAVGDESTIDGEHHETPTRDVSVPSVPDNAPAVEAEGTFDPLAKDEAYLQADAILVDLQSTLANEAESKERDQVAGKLQQQLLNVSLQGRRALARVMDAFRADPTSILGNHLGSILAEIKDPEVEALAHALASSKDRFEKIAGLNLLADLRIPNESSLELTLQVLAASQEDPDVLLSAINAMPVLPQPQIDTEMIIQILEGLTQHGDEAVRSASIFEIAKWAKTAVQLDSVRNALYSASKNDRISAAMAIQESPVVSDVLREDLIARMVDPDELWEIRRMAADSLARFSLNDEQFALFEAFKQERASVSHGG